MAEQQILWSISNYEYAQSKFQFIMVSEGFIPLPSITDMQHIWMVNQEIIFHTSYRICGYPDDIVSSLEREGVEDTEIQSIMDKVSHFKIIDLQLTQIYNQELEAI